MDCERIRKSLELQLARRSGGVPLCSRQGFSNGFDAIHLDVERPSRGSAPAAKGADNVHTTGFFLNGRFTRPDQLGSEETRSWKLFLLHQRRVKLSRRTQSPCALRFFYQKLGRK